MSDLFKAWIDAKAAEQAANTARLAIEQQIVELVGAPAEGTKSHKLDGYKITTGGRLIYKADIPQLITLAEQLPAHLRPVKQEPRLDETGCKWLRANEPQMWALIAPAIEIRPAKASVKIEAINEEN